MKPKRVANRSQSRHYVNALEAIPAAFFGARVLIFCQQVGNTSPNGMEAQFLLIIRAFKPILSTEIDVCRQVVHKDGCGTSGGAPLAVSSTPLAPSETALTAFLAALPRAPLPPLQ